MSDSVWKAFEQNPLTHSAAHYLMTVHEIQDTNGYARVTDVAKALDISLPSCSQSLKNLEKKGWLTENEDKFFVLTDIGLAQVELVEKNKVVLLTFFRDILGVSEERADVDSCKMEHLVSPETSKKLCHFLQALQSDSPEAKAFLDSYEEVGVDNKGCYKPGVCAKSCPHAQK